MINWKDQSREDEFHFLMVDPHNLDMVRGELRDVLLDQTSLTEGYDTDTKVSGSISFLRGSYIPNSWLRIIHEVRKWDYRNEMGTFIMTNPNSSDAVGAGTDTFDLQSSLWAMSRDYCPFHFAIGENAYALDAVARICDNCGRPYIIGANANNFRYTTSKVYEMGDSYLSDLSDICNNARDSLGVDGHGRIIINRFVHPSYVTPSWNLNFDDSKSLIKSDGISYSSTYYDVPNRAIVIYQNDNIEIYAYADAPSSYTFSIAQRGYICASVNQINDLSPATKMHAQTLASQFLEEGYTGTVTYKLTSLYFPAHVGETLNLTFNGENHHCLIFSIDPLNLKDMTMGLTLREV